MTISVSIPAYNEEKYIGECLKSLLANAPAELLEVIVVDNASTDRTAAVAGSFAGVRVVKEPQKGLTRARQRGFVESRGEILACIDADTRIWEGWFPQIMKEFQKDPRLVCLSGPFHFYDLPHKQNVLVRFWNWCAAHVSGTFGVVAQGGNYVIRRSALEQIGGFDTSIEFYGEDTNIARRLAKVGKVKFTPSFYIYTSARRLKSEGIFTVGYKYLANFLSEALLKRQVTKKYRDFR
ncbi:MAG: glycosyltransferase [Patescibacteria group bacterium]|nr:glycosyltransferase [Patescibacteria group bacterium]